MTTFVHWVLAQRHRLIILAAAIAPLFTAVSSALIALETIQRGAVRGVSSAALATLGVVLLALASGASMAGLGAIAACGLLAGVGMGALLRWGDSLGLAFQAMALLTACVLLLLAIAIPDLNALAAPLLEEGVRILRAGGTPEEQLAALREWGESRLFGWLAGGIFAQLICALLLGRWWSTLASGEHNFGTQFRALKLGKVLGIPATLLFGASLVLESPLVQNLGPTALFAFCFQGLAVLHAWAHSRRWHVGLVAPVYVLLVTPLTGIVILALSSVGLMDNWFDLRAPLRARV